MHCHEISYNSVCIDFIERHFFSSQNYFYLQPLVILGCFSFKLQCCFFISGCKLLTTEALELTKNKSKSLDFGVRNDKNLSVSISHGEHRWPVQQGVHAVSCTCNGLLRGREKTTSRNGISKSKEISTSRFQSCSAS